ncbi:hypothetical protein AYO40_02155 [Planctomycetaceae bacterium SCGC AG-212-D15]|nr:hypothetical protein AYO40_02155 [Planctomycetaceae bacterium SCGC AG-212-D15]
MSKPQERAALTGAEAEQQLRRMTRRSFLTGAAAGAVGLGAWGWLTTAAQEDGIPWPLRRALRFNQGLAESLAPPTRLAPTFPAASVQGSPRTNGLVGLEEKVKTAGWKVRVEHEDRRPAEMLPLPDIHDLPRQDLVAQMKCVEGWSEVMHFGGVTFLNFVTHFKLATRSGQAPDPVGNPQDLYRYVYLATPDAAYYVGLDMASALHPQTLLCDMMNWQPLTMEHGSPLRLYLAVKYGYKSLKRVGLIRFQDERPADYWAGDGYDWYAGL